MIRECSICYRPMQYLYATVCGYCAIKIKKDGYAHYRIRLGEVGLDTVNYQQHLHRKFFGCNAPVEYRGIKENRVYNSLKPQTVQSLKSKLHSTLLKCLNKNLLWLYKDNCKLNNFTERLLYNATLYFIHYHITNGSKYESEDHFKSSLIVTLLNHILKTYVRIHRNTILLDPHKTRISLAKAEKTHFSFTRREELYECLSYVCGEVVSTIKL